MATQSTILRIHINHIPFTRWYLKRSRSNRLSMVRQSNERTKCNNSILLIDGKYVIFAKFLTEIGRTSSNLKKKKTKNKITSIESRELIAIFINVSITIDINVKRSQASRMKCRTVKFESIDLYAKSVIFLCSRSNVQIPIRELIAKCALPACCIDRGIVVNRARIHKENCARHRYAFALRLAKAI